jgi:hypothetical protein
MDAELIKAIMEFQHKQNEMIMEMFDDIKDIKRNLES